MKKVRAYVPSIGVCSLIIVVLIPVVLGARCSKDFRTSMEQSVGPLLLPGHRHFKIERENVDVGVVVFSYVLSEETSGEAVVAALRDRLTTKYPCYSVLHASANHLQVRCGNREGRLSGAEEYRIAFDPNVARVIVLWLRDVPAQADVYDQFARTLDEVRDRYRQSN